ncbi:hemophore-related protein [Nocardia shimofusensis]|uniref:hemophore-related protein n=1 Tax=Nocardia shimofusensis TaxID=228596 RepID=UPI000A04EFE6|nr:hemophore-related protein [Nocardia shimofusensis]
MRVFRAPVIAGLVAACAVLTPASAFAAPGAGLPETTCTYEQVEAAARAEFPRLAARLDADPELRDKARAFFALSPQERQQRAREFLDSHPQARAKFEERRGTPRAQEFRDRWSVVLTDTCHRY